MTSNQTAPDTSLRDYGRVTNIPQDHVDGPSDGHVSSSGGSNKPSCAKRGPPSDSFRTTTVSLSTLLDADVWVANRESTPGAVSHSSLRSAEVSSTIRDGRVTNIPQDHVDGPSDGHVSSSGGSNKPSCAKRGPPSDGERTATASRGTLSTPDAAEWPVGARVTGA